MTRVALLTCARLPQGESDDVPLIRALHQRGLAVRLLPWNASAESWKHVDAAIIRSTWDYHTQLPSFLATLEAISVHTTLANSLPHVRWNANKTYLFDLADRGIPIVPTALASEVSSWTQWNTNNEVVLKPAVGLGGHGIVRCNKQDVPTILTRFGQAQVLIQPYMHTIESRGEMSIVFVAGQPTHSVRKLPRNGEFRVQRTFGGHESLQDPDPDHLAVATAALDALPKPLFARVDLLMDTDGIPLVSEVELIEPRLHFRLYPTAAQKMADAIGDLVHVR